VRGGRTGGSNPLPRALAQQVHAVQAVQPADVAAVAQLIHHIHADCRARPVYADAALHGGVILHDLGVIGSPPTHMSAPTTVKVKLVSGEEITVLTPAEARWFESSRDTYMSQTKFTETTDLRDLDRLLFMELMVYRLSQYLAAGVDYDGFEIDDTLLRRNVREYSEQITRVKGSMGLTKPRATTPPTPVTVSVHGCPT
jgi:hypothetical protein